jgi:hypothetical protein
MEVVFQGDVATNGSTRIDCTSTSMVINSIIINNVTSNYVFTLNRFKTSPSVETDVLIYEFTLNTGETIRDTENYVLFRGNYLQFISDVAGTTYYVSATQS